MMTITIGFDVISENLMLSLQTHNKMYNLEMTRLHGNHPYPVGKLDKRDVISLRKFLDEVLND